ncbi:hypothetical protein BTN99_08915 [Vibrio campbellii]|nr:hypothetical protein BTN99_08915 [Vibrio campbellii]
MNKKILLLLLLPFFSNAKNVNFTVGAGLSADNNHIVGSSSETYVLRAGAIRRDTHRFLGTYTYSDESKLTKYLGSYDYMFTLDSRRRWNPFAGVSMGYKKQDVDISDNNSFYVIGGQAGLNYRFSKHASTELGYRVLSGGTQEDESMKDELYWTLDFKF